MLIIKGVRKDGLARKYGIKRGDALVALGGFPVADFLDYVFYDAKESFSLTFSRRGKERTAEVAKGGDESLGLTFESDGLDIRTCRNNCMFCFVDQMPKGMRASLYVKDDDYRQSFLYGNFVTLTNLSDEDAARIVRLKLSPMYISVHSMQESTRCRVMNNRFAGRIAGYLSAFARAGIVMHTQVVLVRGENDGDDLRETARRLFALRPQVKTMAVVPCGVTKYREGLAKIPDIDADYAREVLALVSELNEAFGENFVQPADEFYFKAGLPLPPPEFYGDFDQIENGVGMTAKFSSELGEALAGPPRSLARPTTFLLVSGTSAADFIRSAAGRAQAKTGNMRAVCVGAVNRFFGETVNCTGLLTGGDIARAAEECPDGWDVLVIASSTLRKDERVFLDDMTAGQLADRLKRPVRITDGTGESFYDALSLDEYEDTVFPAVSAK